MRNSTRQRGTLYDRAQEFMAALERQESAAASDMLAAWSDSYWATRQELDTLLAKVAAARAAGVPVNRSWLNQQGRLKNVLATTKAEMARYAMAGAEVTTAQQRRALAAALKDAATLTQDAVSEGLPGWDADLMRTNPENLARLVGFLGDGTPLHRLATTLGDDAADRLRSVLTQGITLGWGQDRMVRAFTEGLAVTHSRAVTILRTESLRVYRETSRATYAANRNVIGTWVWTCALDRRSCPACVIMHGTEHDPDETLDGHPRCRCAMVPRTVSWESLGLEGLPDTRPPLQSGKAWLEGQSAATQRGILGRAKYDAWKAGNITLDDMVARRFDPDWGTMRTERSLKSIQENRNANWFGPADGTDGLTPQTFQHGATTNRDWYDTDPRIQVVEDSTFRMDAGRQAMLHQRPRPGYAPTPEDLAKAGWSNYTGSPADDVNRYLRGLPLEDYDLDQVARLAETVDAFHDRYGFALDRDTILYRGVRATGDWSPGQYGPGDLIPERGWSSMTVDRDTAEAYATGGRGASQPWVYEIRLPAGARVFPGDVGIGELVGQRGAVLRVVERDDAARVLRLEWVL